jgi:hypothetical protein
MQSSSSSTTSLSSSSSSSTHQKSDHIQILANMDIFLAICDKISKFMHINHILLYFNDDAFATIAPRAGESLGYYQNDKPVVFGNFPDQTIHVNPSFFTDWQRYRGTLKTLLIYNRALTDTQIRVVFNNLRRGV